jgi:hypothetical protein
MGYSPMLSGVEWCGVVMVPGEPVDKRMNGEKVNERVN